MSLSPSPAHLDIGLQPKQGLLLTSEATEILYGGAAGGGKSYAMRQLAILWAWAFPGLQVYLFRRISDDLTKNHVEGPTGFQALLSGWVSSGFCEIVQGEIRFWNGSKIYLCHCHEDKDRFKYQGAEIHVLLIDELTHFSEVVYRFLRSRVRMTGLTLPEEIKDRFPRIIAASNPGNIGHQWVKRTFIDPKQPMETWRAADDEGGMLRQYIPARLDDNAELMRADPQYRTRLRGLGSSALVKAMEEGDWNIIEGAFFDCWSTERHVLRPFTIPQHWTRFRSFDWGSAKPFSVGWWAVASEDHDIEGGRTIPRGALVRYREWYGCKEGQENVGLKLTAEQVAQGILTREAGESIDYSVADPSIFKEDGGPSIGERMAGCGVYFRAADNARVAGWDQVRRRMMGEADGEPAIYFFSTCTDTIRTLPAMLHDEHRPEDIDSDLEDHALDETRYAAMSRPYKTAKPVEAADPFRLPTMGELTQKQVQKWQATSRSRI